MATYPVQTYGQTGLNATYNAAAGGGDRVPPGSVLHIKNGSGSAMTCSLVTLDTVDGNLTVADRQSASISAGGALFFYVPEVYPYVDPSDGMVGVTWSATTSITFAVLATP